MVNLKSIPFLKILIPYLFGILACSYLGMFQNVHIVFLVAFFIWLVSFVFQKFHTESTYLKKGIYIICTNILLFLLAYESCYLYSAKNNINHYSHYVNYHEQNFIASVTDIPVTSEKFIKVPVSINFIEAGNQWHYTEGNTIIYLKNDSSLNLNLGSKLLLHTKFSHVNEPKNPYEFDYKTFLENKNIFHVVYANSSNAHIIKKDNYNFSIAQVGTQIKSHLVSVLRNSKLSPNAFAISSALLVGYDDEIDSEVMQSFSHSVIDKYDRYKKTKFVAVVISLFLFVVITGLSPSVLRAALMLTLILFGKTFYKQGNTYNTLLFSAFLLLLINPFLIKDVGFLLSYSAVVGIMYLYPILARLYVFESKIAQWLWTSVLISVAATVFTLPISLYFFHQFPIWFAFSNLLIIPISMFLMLCAALFLLLYKIIFLNQVLVCVMNGTTSMMLWLAQLTDNPKYGFIDFIPFAKLDVLFVCIVITLVLLITATKSYKYVMALCFTVITWLSFSIYSSFEQKQNKELIVFHVKQKSVFALRIGHTVYAHFEDISNSEFQRYVKPYLLTISNLRVVDTRANILKVGAKRILNNTQQTPLSKTIDSDYIIVSNNNVLELTTNYKTKPLIIADCSNSYKFVKQLKKQCALLEIPFYWVKENGAVQIKL